MDAAADNDIDQAPDVVVLQPYDTLMDVNPSSLLLKVRLQCHDFSSEHSLCIENLGILVLQLLNSIFAEAIWSQQPLSMRNNSSPQGAC